MRSARTKDTRETIHDHRAAIREALRGVSRLESMAVTFANKGKAEIRGAEVTRTEFCAVLAAEADALRSKLRDALVALALDR